MNETEDPEIHERLVRRHQHHIASLLLDKLLDLVKLFSVYCDLLINLSPYFQEEVHRGFNECRTDMGFNLGNELLSLFKHLGRSRRFGAIF